MSIAEAIEACREMLQLEIAPLGEAKKEKKWGSLVEERMTQGKQLKKLGDSKMEEGQTRDAVFDHLYATLRFYQCAVAMYGEKKPLAGRQLLEQTGRYAVGCAQKAAQKTEPLTLSLLYFVAAACFGRAFSMTWKITRKDHKVLLAEARKKKEVERGELVSVEQQSLKGTLEASENVYEALRWRAAAVDFAKDRLQFGDVLNVSENDLIAFIDNAIKLVHEEEAARQKIQK